MKKVSHHLQGSKNMTSKVQKGPQAQLEILILIW